MIVGAERITNSVRGPATARVLPRGSVEVVLANPRSPPESPEIPELAADLARRRDGAFLPEDEDRLDGAVDRSAPSGDKGLPDDDLLAVKERASAVRQRGCWLGVRVAPERPKNGSRQAASARATAAPVGSTLVSLPPTRPG